MPTENSYHPIIQKLQNSWNERDIEEVEKKYKCRIEIKKDEWKKIATLSFNESILDNVMGIDFYSFGLHNIAGDYKENSRFQSFGVKDEKDTYRPVLIYETNRNRLYKWPRNNETKIKVDMSYLNDKRVCDVLECLIVLSTDTNYASFILSKVLRDPGENSCLIKEYVRGLK